MTPTNVEYVTVPGAAAELGKSVNWIRHLIKEQRILGARKLGRDWIIPSPVIVLQPQRARLPNRA